MVKSVKENKALQDAYQLLGVSSANSAEEINAAYKTKKDGVFSKDGKPLRGDLEVRKASQEAKKLREAHMLISADRGFVQEAKVSHAEPSRITVEQDVIRVKKVPTSKEIDAAYNTLNVSRISSKEDIEEQYKKTLKDVTMDKSTSAVSENARRAKVLKEAYDHVMYDQAQKEKPIEQGKPRFPVVSMIKRFVSRTSASTYHVPKVKSTNQRQI